MKKLFFTFTVLLAALCGFNSCDDTKTEPEAISYNINVKYDNDKDYIYIGDEVEINITSEPAEGFSLDEVTYTFDDKEQTAIEVARTAKGYKVTGKKKGSVDVSIFYKGELVKKISITVKQKGYKFVDLGLSVMWATCNIGAENPWENGQYFAWGDTKGYAKGKAHTFNWENYVDNPSKDGETFITYKNEDGGLTELKPEHDAATKNWGGKWRMPSKEESAELYDEEKIHSEWVTNYKNSGKSGYVFYKKKEGETTYDVNSDLHIFLPAAGFRRNDKLFSEGNFGYYWSRSLNEYFVNCADYLSVSSSSVGTDNSSRYDGQSVRPVCPRAE